MDELKPCPFCGGPAELVEMNPAAKWYYVICDGSPELGCSVQPATSDFDNAAEAIAAWNRRAGEET